MTPHDNLEYFCTLKIHTREGIELNWIKFNFTLSSLDNRWRMYSKLPHCNLLFDGALWRSLMAKFWVHGCWISWILHFTFRLWKLPRLWASCYILLLLTVDVSHNVLLVVASVRFCWTIVHMEFRRTNITLNSSKHTEIREAKTLCVRIHCNMASTRVLE